MISLGCAKNLVDSEVMLGQLDRAGCQMVVDPADAEVIVVNTCAFIEASREESIETILRVAELKKSGRLKRLVVAGCLVQRAARELRDSLPEVDAFIGLDELDQVVAAAGLGSRTAVDGNAALRLFGDNHVTPAGRSTYLYDHETPRRLATPPWTAYVKIAEGCDHTCAFCAIPSFRGRLRSRSVASVTQEIVSLVAGGVREVSLVAQDSSHYGRDLDLRDGLVTLLEALDQIDGLRWIRLHYLYPNTVTQKLIDTLGRLEHVVPYVDLPLQHAHPEVLRRMRRGGSAEDHLRLLGRFRRAIPDVAIRTTMITGFPGESEAEFDALVDFVRTARFDHLGVFTYSHEDATPAFGDADDVPEPLKHERRERLQDCQSAIVSELLATRVGREAVVLVEGAHAETEHLLVGRLPQQALDVDGQVLLVDGAAEPGCFARVRLTEVAGCDLVGEIVGPA